jgi:hypothetical protein
LLPLIAGELDGGKTMLINYVEMKDTSNPDEWSNKVDLYGYENRVLVMAMGYSKTIQTDCRNTTVDCINDIVTKLESNDFVVINKEEKVRCCACNEVSFKSNWKKDEVINNQFVGGCPFCKGEFFEEVINKEEKQKIS